MKTNIIIKALAFTMLLTTACNKEDEVIKDEVTNEASEETANEKGYALPVTLNVTRQGDEPTTRATYNGTTKKLEFSEGDKLFIQGCDYHYLTGAGSFAGTLDWQSGGTFSGTIYTRNEYSGTVDDLLTAADSYDEVYAHLLPNGYETYGFCVIEESGTYYAHLSPDFSKSFALTKAAAVEQFSYEYADNYDSDYGFDLTPHFAILNFTIMGLTSNKNVTATLTDENSEVINVISKELTTDGSGNATFAIGIAGGLDLINTSLTVDGTEIDLVNASKEVVAGKVYNITRSAAPAAKALSAATAEDKGKLAGQNGKIYDNAAAATAAGTTAVAKIIYIGTTGHATYSHGLALALTDEGQMAWDAAKTACNTTKNTNTPVTDATWLLASKDQWDYMMGTDGAGSDTALSEGFSGITGASNLQPDNYWSSTEYNDTKGWLYYFDLGGWGYEPKSYVSGYVRACLVF